MSAYYYQWMKPEEAKEVIESLNFVGETRERMALYGRTLTRQQRRAMEVRYPEGTEKPVSYSECGRRLFESGSRVQQLVKEAAMLMRLEKRKLDLERNVGQADYDRGFMDGKIAGARELITQLQILVGDLELPDLSVEEVA